jgi:glycosyltransferase involved in cell wall biosynthesis
MQRRRLLVSRNCGIFFRFPGITLNVLFTSTLNTSFIREDLALLRRHVQVDHLQATGILAPLRMLRRIPRADVTYTWFASVYAFAAVALARIFGRPSIVVVGGVDASKEPEIGYGIWLSPWKSILVRWAVRHAHRILAVDPWFTGELKRLAAYEGRNIEVVPTGYDASRWTPHGDKEKIVLTVAGCHDRARMKKKGIDLLYDAARRMPETAFVVIGLSPVLLRDARAEAPANVRLISFVEQDDLLGWYRRAAVYCQPSFAEGLPNSLCEAMLCCCVPVGTRVGGIPTAIRDIGFLVPYGDPDALAGALQKALAAGSGTGLRAREHIATHFTLERREEALVRVLRECAR